MAGVVVVGWVGGRCLRLGDTRARPRIAQMDVPECKRELQREREQRERSANLRFVRNQRIDVTASIVTYVDPWPY